MFFRVWHRGIKKKKSVALEIIFLSKCGSWHYVQKGVVSQINPCKSVAFGMMLVTVWHFKGASPQVRVFGISFLIIYIGRCYTSIIISSSSCCPVIIIDCQIIYGLSDPIELKAELRRQEERKIILRSARTKKSYLTKRRTLLVPTWGVTPWVVRRRRRRGWSTQRWQTRHDEVTSDHDEVTLDNNMD